MTLVTGQLRQRVMARAANRCEYCLLPANLRLLNFHVDHVRALKHGGTSEFDNLCYCCSHCNLHKGTDPASYDPQTDALTLLFNPRVDQWAAHFSLAKPTGLIVPHTATARTTIYLLRLNAEAQIHRRTTLLDLGYTLDVG